jgi:AcrR family transcriptional regulator
MTAGQLFRSLVSRPTRQRARNSTDKQLRRNAIIEVATALLGDKSYAELTMAEVAAAAGIAKGTVYLYFASKEELMLAVFERELASLFADFAGELARGPVGAAEEFATLLAGALERHPIFVDLSTVLHTIFERNIDLDTAVRFKHVLRDHIVAAGDVVELLFPFLRKGEGVQLFLRSHAMLIGVRNLSDPAPLVAEAHRQPGLEIFEVDFATEYVDMMVCMLRGMQARAQEVLQ